MYCDATGNITQARGLTFVWNQRAGQLKTVSQGATLLATYFYDYQGRRTRKITTASAPQGAGTVIYAYDLYDRLKGELDGAGNPLRTYVWRDDVPVSIIVHSTPEVAWYLEVDHLNTPLAARDLTGKIIWRWEADAFGSTQPNEDPDGDTQTTTINLRYPGQYYDQESGLHYNHRRYYDPKLGRYMSPDPIGLAGGANLYGYVNGNPISRVDPSGLLQLSDFAPSQGVLDFSTGVADAASLGLGLLARDALGIDGGVDKCSKAYRAGEWVSLALGAGRMAYAGMAKVGAAMAADGAAAMAFRNSVKRVMRGPLAGSEFRIKNYADLMEHYGSDAAVKAAAGRTSKGFNATGADLAIGGTVGAASCECQ